MSQRRSPKAARIRAIASGSGMRHDSSATTQTYFANHHVRGSERRRRVPCSLSKAAGTPPPDRAFARRWRHRCTADASPVAGLATERLDYAHGSQRSGPSSARILARFLRCRNRSMSQYATYPMAIGKVTTAHHHKNPPSSVAVRTTDTTTPKRPDVRCPYASLTGIGRRSWSLMASR